MEVSQRNHDEVGLDSEARVINMRACWCGNTALVAFSPAYSECRACGTLISQCGLSDAELLVEDDESDFYGKQYWLNYQNQNFGFPDIYKRARGDLTERNLYWLKALLKYSLPPQRIMELGCAHGSFVALMQHAGFKAHGVEMSPWVVAFAKKLFNVPVDVGPVESLEISKESQDVIVLMDVMEHLPDPLATMRHCLDLLKPEGFLLVQTPQFREGVRYDELVECQSTFLDQLKSHEHLYLFSDRSVVELFRRLGAHHLCFEPAIFAHYDMFFVVSKAPLACNSQEQIARSLQASPSGRMVQAMLDLSALEESHRAGVQRLAQAEADINFLKEQISIAEADRAARLAVIQRQGDELSQIPKLQADIDYLLAELGISEMGRSSALKVVFNQGREIFGLVKVEAEKQLLEERSAQLEADLAKLRSHWWSKLGKKIKLL